MFVLGTGRSRQSSPAKNPSTDAFPASLRSVLLPARGEKDFENESTVPNASVNSSKRTFFSVGVVVMKTNSKSRVLCDIGRIHQFFHFAQPGDFE